MTDRQLTFEFDFRPALDRENFLVAPCNELAVQWLDRWPDWPSTAVCIHGPAGSGKTHLAHVWASMAQATIIDGPALGKEVSEQELAGRPVVIDDAHLVPDPVSLFHLYNMQRAARQHILLIAPEPPAKWGISLPDLLSRLNTAQLAPIDIPDDELLMMILIKQFSDRQITVAMPVIRFLVARMERSFDAARQIVEALDQAGLAQGRAVTRKLAAEILAGPPAEQGDRD